MLRILAIATLALFSAADSAPKEPAKDRYALRIETARFAAKEMLDALYKTDAQEALIRFAESAKTSTNVKAKPGSAAFVKALTTPIDRITRPIRDRHDLKGSLDDVMLAIQKKAREHKDHIVLAQIEDIGELLTGEVNPQRQGRSPHLDAIAEAYLDMDQDARNTALAKAQAVIKADKNIHAASALYISTMQAIHQGGNRFVVDQMVETYMADPEPENKQIILNILSQFLRAEDKKEVSAGIKARMDAKKAEDDKKKAEKKFEDEMKQQAKDKEDTVEL